jgi:hypothetical protein
MEETQTRADLSKYKAHYTAIPPFIGGPKNNYMVVDL